MQSQRVVMGILRNDDSFSYIGIDRLEDEKTSAAALVGYDLASLDITSNNMTECYRDRYYGIKVKRE